MNKSDMERITTVSRQFNRLFLLMIFIIPVACIIYWLNINHLPNSLLPVYPFEIPQLSLISRVFAILASLLPISIVIIALIQLLHLFRLYEQGIFFSNNNVRIIHKLGQLLFLWIVTHLISKSLLSVIITSANPPGERMLTIQFTLTDLTMLVLGGIVILISWIMNEGRKIEDEHIHTI